MSGVSGGRVSVGQRCRDAAHRYVLDLLENWDSKKLDKFRKLAGACAWDLHYGPSGDHFDLTEALGFEDGVGKLKKMLEEFEDVHGLGRWIYVGMDSEYVSDSQADFEGYEYLEGDDEEDLVEWMEGEPCMEFSLRSLLVDKELSEYLC